MPRQKVSKRVVFSESEDTVVLRRVSHTEEFQRVTRTDGDAVKTH
jgi:hypothetical protein